MSVSAQEVINECATLIGDPAQQRVDADVWKLFLNQSARDIARKLRLVLWTVTFDIVGNDPEYALPSDCIQVKRVQFNETPSDQTTWWDVKEMFEDEFRAATDGQYPSISRSHRYHIFNDTFWLYPMPDVSVSGGGKITYWGLPDGVTSPSTQVIPLMDFMRDTLRERMIVYGLRRLEKWDASVKAEQEWQASLSSDRTRIEDRSADRRSRIRTSPRNTFGAR